MTGSVTPINDFGNACKAAEEAMVTIRDVGYQLVDQLVDERMKRPATMPYATGEVPTITGDSAVASRVDELLQLGPGWDGNGASPPSEHAVYEAAEMCRKLDMIPLPDGSVEIRLGDWPVCTVAPDGGFTPTDLP